MRWSMLEYIDICPELIGLNQHVLVYIGICRFTLAYPSAFCGWRFLLKKSQMQIGRSFGVEINAEKTKVMTYNAEGIRGDIRINDKRLETVNQLKSLGAIVTDEGSKPEILLRIAQATHAMSQLKIIWKDKNISLWTKIRPMCTLVLSIFLHACKTLTLTHDMQKRIQAMEVRCFWSILQISYKDHVTNNEMHFRIETVTWPYEDLLTIVKKCKMRWYGHVSQSNSLAETIFQGTVPGTRRRGRQHKRWEDNIKEWTGLYFAESQITAKDRM